MTETHERHESEPHILIYVILWTAFIWGPVLGFAVAGEVGTLAGFVGGFALAVAVGTYPNLADEDHPIGKSLLMGLLGVGFLVILAPIAYFLIVAGPAIILGLIVVGILFAVTGGIARVVTGV